MKPTRPEQEKIDAIRMSLEKFVSSESSGSKDPKDSEELEQEAFVGFAVESIEYLL